MAKRTFTVADTELSITIPNDLAELSEEQIAEESRAFDTGGLLRPVEVAKVLRLGGLD